MITYSELSSEGPVLHMAHANAYPFGCYRTFLKPFTNEYRVLGMNSRPMWKDSSPKGLKNWKVLGDDLIQFFDEQNFRGIIGIGHSMGSVYSLLAASKRPDLFSKLILIDPVIIPKVYYYLSVLPMSIRKKINPTINIALRRTDEWNSKEDAIAYLNSKKVFQRFHPDSFEDFVNGGLKMDDDKVRLAFPRAWEAQIYATATSIWHLLKNPPCPLIIIRAEYSNVISANLWERIKKMSPVTEYINFEKAGHLIPMEKPHELSSLISGYLK